MTSKSSQNGRQERKIRRKHVVQQKNGDANVSATVSLLINKTFITNTLFYYHSIIT